MVGIATLVGFRRHDDEIDEKIPDVLVNGNINLKYRNIEFCFGGSLAFAISILIRQEHWQTDAVSGY